MTPDARAKLINLVASATRNSTPREIEDLEFQLVLALQAVKARAIARAAGQREKKKP